MHAAGTSFHLPFGNHTHSDVAHMQASTVKENETCVNLNLNKSDSPKLIRESMGAFASYIERFTSEWIRPLY